LSLVVYTAIDGTHLSEPFTANISFSPPNITPHGLPNSTQIHLPAGQPTTATITVVNTGNINKGFFADARPNNRTSLTLAGSDVSAVPLPLSPVEQPNWRVPTHSDALVVQAQATAPIVMDVASHFGDPDILGEMLAGNGSLATIAAQPEIAPGLFFTFTEPLGPFPLTGIGGSPSVNLIAAVTTNPFDSTVIASTGDKWA
jgi:hypothetical protein